MSFKNIKTKIYYFLLLIFVVEAAVLFGKNTINNQTYSKPQVLSATVNLASNKAKITNYKFPILIYHYIEIVKDQKDTIRKSLNIPPSVFEAQIKTLQENGYVFITPKEMDQLKNGQKEISGKPIILSFDDGYGDFYTDIFPILKKYQVKAVAYIVPGFLGKPNYMSWDQVREISQSNLVEIGAHSMHHPSLKDLDKGIAQYEIAESKKELEQTLGMKVSSFAYPFGAFNQQAEDIVNSSGFANAMTTISGVNDNSGNVYLLKRIHPGTRTGNNLISYIENPIVRIVSNVKSQSR